LFFCHSSEISDIYVNFFWCYDVYSPFHLYQRFFNLILYTWKVLYTCIQISRICELLLEFHNPKNANHLWPCHTIFNKYISYSLEQFQKVLLFYNNTIIDQCLFVGLASTMKCYLTKYDNLFKTSFPYSMGWHGKYSMVWHGILEKRTIKSIASWYSLTWIPLVMTGEGNAFFVDHCVILNSDYL